MVPTGLFYFLHDSTEVAIKKMIEASQKRMLKVISQGGEELGGMSPPLKRHLEPQIKTLENAPRYADKKAFASKRKTKGRSNAH
jgi:hypothetical protein